jgi:hypothetical protein
VPTITLTERLDQARREAGDLRDQLAVADSELNEALERRDYAAAEGLKLAADALRQPLYISAATVTALEAAVKQLADHEAEQQRAAFERDRRDQAAAQHLQAREREAEAEEDLSRFLAEVPAAWGALADAMLSAIDAEQRVAQARRDAHSTGIVAGHFDPGLPVPVGPNRASARFESNRCLVEILRNPRLTL